MSHHYVSNNNFQADSNEVQFYKNETTTENAAANNTEFKSYGYGNNERNEVVPMDVDLEGLVPPKLVRQVAVSSCVLHRRLPTIFDEGNDEGETDTEDNSDDADPWDDLTCYETLDE